MSESGRALSETFKLCELLGVEPFRDEGTTCLDAGVQLWKLREAVAMRLAQPTTPPAWLAPMVKAMREAIHGGCERIAVAIEGEQRRPYEETLPGGPGPRHAPPVRSRVEPGTLYGCSCEWPAKAAEALADAQAQRDANATLARQCAELIGERNEARRALADLKSVTPDESALRLAARELVEAIPGPGFNEALCALREALR